MLSWLAMGGYWPYVWGAYAIAAVGLGALSVWALSEHAKAARAAARLNKAP